MKNRALKYFDFKKYVDFAGLNKPVSAAEGDKQSVTNSFRFSQLIADWPSLYQQLQRFFQHDKQNEFTGSISEYENRKLEILIQLNQFQLFIGFLMPVSVFFSEKTLPFLSALIFIFPPLINALVLYLGSKQRNLEAMVAYFVLYPFFTNLAYIDSFNLGTELFFVLYSILSVFFLQQIVHLTICFVFNTINYFMLVVLLKKYQVPSEVDYPFYFLLNHLIAIVIIFYSLYLIKKENAGYQVNMLEKNNELQMINEEIRRQKEEIAEKAEQLEQQAIQLNKMDGFKNRLFSIVSHDLKAPLYALRNLFAEINQQKMSAAEIRSLIPDVLKDLNYATGLTDNLLNWAKSQMNAESVSPRVINISAMIGEVVQLLRLQAELKDISIKCRFRNKLSIYADSDMIRLVLRNLLSNAIKFTPSGGTISVDVNELDSYVEVIIEDTGEGMDNDALEKIRNCNYFTTRGTANEQGTGLGLMLCKEFLAKNNGLLHIESQKGKGSMFSFTLPAANQ